MRSNQASAAAAMTAKEVHVPDSLGAVLAAKRLFHLATLWRGALLLSEGRREKDKG